MKLYVHNFLQDNIESTRHYPLKIVPTSVRTVSVELNPDFIANLARRIDLMALEGACRDLNLPFQRPGDIDHLDEEQIAMLHHVLLEVEVVTGELVSPSGRRFPIISGIPDMCPHIGAPSGPPKEAGEGQ